MTPDLTPIPSRGLHSAAALSGIAALTAAPSGPYQRIRYAVPTRSLGLARCSESGYYRAFQRSRSNARTPSSVLGSCSCRPSTNNSARLIGRMLHADSDQPLCLLLDEQHRLVHPAGDESVPARSKGASGSRPPTRRLARTRPRPRHIGPLNGNEGGYHSVGDSLRTTSAKLWSAATAVGPIPSGPLISSVVAFLRNATHGPGC
jgi:hypothetical protein